MLHCKFITFYFPVITTLITTKKGTPVGIVRFLLIVFISKISFSIFNKGFKHPLMSKEITPVFILRLSW